MLVISVKDNKSNRWKWKAKPKTKPKQNKEKQSKGDERVEGVRNKLFCWASKLAFLQLICKVPLVFNSNLELTLSIILKEK